LDAYLDGNDAYAPTKKSFKYQETEAIEDLTWTMDLFSEFVVNDDEDLADWYDGGYYLKIDIVKPKKK
jgi:hypothetical protein